MKKRYYKPIRFISVLLIVLLLVQSTAYAHPSAGLYARFTAPNGQYKIEIINLHDGWAGPWPETQNIRHTNVHVYRSTGAGWVEIANYHVSAETQLTSVCYYIYESKTGAAWKNCKSSLGKTAAQNEMQQHLIADINAKTNWQMVGTVAAAVAVVIIVWVFWPASAIGLVAL